MRDEKKVVYSKLSGFNIYQIKKLHSDDMMTLNHFMISDIRTKQEKFFRSSVIYRSEVSLSAEKAAWYADFIQNPVSNILFEWPIDLIEIRTSETFCGCLVFKDVDYQHLTPIKNLLYQPSMSKVLDWRNSYVISICKNFLTSIDALHSNGYIYNDFNINNIMYNTNNGEVFFRFNNSIRKSGGKTKFDKVNSTDISPEFAPPYVYNAEVYNGLLSKRTDFYQITALLFRMMIGRLPYEGRDLMSYGMVFDPDFDTDESAHEYYFKHYHQYPHFVFDDNDNTNSLSSTSDNDLPRERWNTLPEDVKCMFRNVLCQNVAEHITTELLPTPVTWLNVISDLEALYK